MGTELSTAPLFWQIWLQYRAHWIGDIDAFLAVTTRQSFDEFMLEQELMLKITGMQHHIEIDARFAKGVESYSGFDMDIFIHTAHDLTSHFERDAFDLVEVAVVGNADGDTDDDILARQAVIRDLG